MTTLVVGANGATGRLLVEQLLTRGEKVKVIVRSTDQLTKESKNHENLSVIQASLLELGDTNRDIPEQISWARHPSRVHRP